MVDHVLLHKELAALPTAVGESADLHEGMHRLSVTAAAGLGVEGAGVTMRMPSGGTEYISASDAATMKVERAQDALQQGVCVEAISTSQIVAVGDLREETRWPEYRPVVIDAGFLSVAGVPISSQGQNIGALNLYGASSRMWTTEEFAAARLIADLAAGYLINTHLLGTSTTLAVQLQRALDSRVVIEQAKGVICGRHGISPDGAFEIMRSYARTNRAKLRDVAEAVVDGRQDFAPQGEHSTT